MIYRIPFHFLPDRDEKYFNTVPRLSSEEVSNINELSKYFNFNYTSDEEKNNFLNQYDMLSVYPYNDKNMINKIYWLVDGISGGHVYIQLNDGCEMTESLKEHLREFINEQTEEGIGKDFEYHFSTGIKSLEPKSDELFLEFCKKNDIDFENKDIFDFYTEAEYSSKNYNPEKSYAAWRSSHKDKEEILNDILESTYCGHRLAIVLYDCDDFTQID